VVRKRFLLKKFGKEGLVGEIIRDIISTEAL